MSYQRKREEKRRLKKLAEDSCGWHAYYDKRRNRYKRCYLRNSRYTKWVKTQSSRVARRRQNNGEYCNHNGYRKLYDYWWTLW